MAVLMDPTEQFGEDVQRVVQVLDIHGNPVQLRLSDVERVQVVAHSDDDLSVIRAGALAVDLLSREVRFGDTTIRLTRREFDLLAFMAENPRRVFSKAQLLEHVWSSDAAWQSEATVTEHIRRLRRKLGFTKSAESGIITVWGVGYRFIP